MTCHALLLCFAAGGLLFYALTWAMCIAAGRADRLSGIGEHEPLLLRDEWACTLQKTSVSERDINDGRQGSEAA